MDFLSAKEDEESGLPVALEDYEIANLLKLANLSKRDIFFDLGSGWGFIIHAVIEKTKVMSAQGVEFDIKRFLQCIEFVRDEYSPNNMKRIEFWRANIHDFDFSDATIVYNGLNDHGSKSEIEMYERIHERKKKPFEVIKRDLPLFPYKPVKAVRGKRGSWFFMMKTPLKNYKLRYKDEWAKLVMDDRTATIEDVFTYYRETLEERFKKNGASDNLAKKEARNIMKNFKQLTEKHR